MKLETDWRFISKIDINDVTECWNWKASKLPTGYGRINIKNRSIYSHRYAWELINGPIPYGLCVCHKCDNPSCVNPAHLFLGTASANAKDRENKGRGRTTKGLLNGHSKLSEKQVYEIRSATGLHKDIAEQFGIKRSTVGMIKNKLLWKHLP